MLPVWENIHVFKFATHSCQLGPSVIILSLEPGQYLFHTIGPVGIMGQLGVPIWDMYEVCNAQLPAGCHCDHTGSRSSRLRRETYWCWMRSSECRLYGRIHIGIYATHSCQPGPSVDNILVTP